MCHSIITLDNQFERKLKAKTKHPNSNTTTKANNIIHNCQNKKKYSHTQTIDWNLVCVCLREITCSNAVEYGILFYFRHKDVV